MSSTSHVLSAGQFRRACGRFATGVAIAAVSDALGRPHGLTINSFTSVSLEPPLILICIDYRAAILAPFRAATHFGLSILTNEQQEISTRFATRPDDRFDGVDWSLGQFGTPLIDGALAHFETRVDRVIEAGDHAIFLGAVVHAQCSEGEPLIYYQGYQKLASNGSL